MHIHIPEPCHEDWDAMQPVQNGRHCASCSKSVVDFTGMNDRELLDYFKRHSGFCGRFTPIQLNRNLNKKPVKSKHSWVYGAAACSVLLLHAVQADGKPFRPVQQDTTVHQSNKVSMVNGFISRSFLFVFHPSDSVFIQPFSVHFQFESFHLDTIPDSTRQVGFHIPDSISWTTIHVRITDINGRLHDLQIPASAITGQYPGRNDIRLYDAPDGLRFERILPFTGIVFPELPYVMGIPPMHWDFRLKPIELFVNTQTLGFAVMGDTVVLDTPETKLPEKAVKKTLKPDRRTGSKVPGDQYWFAGIIGLLIAAVVLWIKRGPKQAPHPKD